MMQKTIKIKPYKEENINKVVDLLNICFPSQEISLASFKWKHFDSFYNESSKAMVASDNGFICSFVCFVPLRIHAQDNSVKTIYSCAVQATHPDYRRKGIVTKLTQIIEKNVEPRMQYIGFSNEQGVMIDRYSKKIHYTLVGKFYRKYVLTSPAKIKFSVHEILSPINLRQQSSLYRIVKNEAYLNWRYAMNPKNKYKYLRLSKNGTTIGQVVYNINGFRLELIDLMLINDSQELLETALNTVCDYAFRNKALFLTHTFLKNNYWKNAHSKCSMEKFIHTYLTVKSPVKSFANVENWNCQGGDVQ